MFAKFEHIIEGAYDYNEALKRQSLKQEDVDLLRQKAKKSKIIPRFIHDKQVNQTFHLIPGKGQTINFSSASLVRQRMQRRCR